MKLKLPKKLGTYRGKAFSKYYVRVSQSDIAWQDSIMVSIIAESPIAACNAIRDEFAPLVNRPTEFEVLGPKGGITYRYVGYDSLVWAKMCAQMDLEKTEFTLQT